MFKKRVDKELNNRQYMANAEFSQTMEIAHWYAEMDKTLNERVIILQYMIDVIKRDLQAEQLIFKRYIDKNVNLGVVFFPINYYDEQGTNLELSSTGEVKTISLKDDCVITYPRDKSKTINSVLNLKNNEFQYISANHSAVYYTEIEICNVLNGHHSIAAGIYHKKGEIKAKVVDIKPMFQHVRADGSYFYNSHTGEKLVAVDDFRVAILYEIAKLKYNLQNQRG